MKRKRVANLDSVKLNNLSIVFKTIVEFGQISRTQLADKCGLAAGSVTKMTRLLMEQGLIHEVAQAESGRGRKATLLAAKTADFQVIAARAGRRHLYVGLCDLSGNLLKRDSSPLQVDGQQEFATQVIGALKNFLLENQALLKTIIGIGVTVPGLVDGQRGVIAFMPHLQVHDLHLSELIAETLGYPCFVNNFSSAMALAEKQIGVSTDVENSMFITLHNGVGSGFVLNNRLYTGAAVGELGHIQVDPLGNQCVCGNFGCLETVVSNSAILTQYERIRLSQSLVPDEMSMTIERLCQLAKQGDKTAVKVLREAIQKLGEAVAMVVNILRPEKIVFAGEVFAAWDVVKPVLEFSIARQSIHNENIQDVKLVQSKLFESPWTSGYALVRHALLSGELLGQLLDS